MSRKHIGFVTALVLMVTALPVFAGGPLIIFDSSTQTPYAYPPGVVSVYTDLGSNGILTGPESDALTVNGFAEWTGVPSSYFAAAVAGDFASVGLPDIDGFNAGLVIGTFNGGGIHVMYDNDASIVFNFFGAPPGVLGIASPDFSVTGSPDLLESWAVLNGTSADPADIGGVSFGGVFTHEFGHSINLAHTQTNGAVGFFGDSDGPDLCATPYAFGLTFNDFETMYPFIDPSAGSVGVDMATLNVLDDIAAVSDVYPTGGWPNNTGTISGKVFAPDGITEVSGINLIVRNVADPYEDANSALSGDYTQIFGDGRFTLTGLTPGANYVVYIDEIVAGGFSTTPGTIPGDGDEEYWNAAEDSDPSVDDPCDWTFIVPAAGVAFNADVIANGDPNDLGLGDDDFVEVPLPFSFPFCGMNYNSIFVNSNGNMTFGAGDTDFSESVPEFLANEPRIAPCWVDLNPTGGGTISALPDGPDFVVSYNNVPEFPATGSNSFSVTLRADGTYDVDYGTVTAGDGIAGRTEGGGAADPGSTDLTAEPQPIGVGMATVYEAFGFGANDLDSEFMAFGTCVIPDPPAIAVDPASLSACLLPDQTSAQTLTVTNLGDLDLNFNILSDQLFLGGPSPAPGVLEPRDYGTPGPDPEVSEATLTRLLQDRESSRPGKPEVSPLVVPLPHIYALSLVNEDFNAGFPAGWSAIDNEGGGVIWSVPQQGTGNHTGATGDAAGANSDYVGPADYDTELRTPPITDFGPNVVLSYVANYQNFANWDFLDVDVSTDGGVNWTTVFSWNEDHGGFFGPPGEAVALDLDPFVAGSSEFIVRWRWYNPTTTSDWDWYVQIDDVMIVSDELLTPCSYLSVAPTGGTVFGDGSMDVDVTFDATGFDPGTYDCELIIFSNAVNEPRLVVPLEMVVAQAAVVDIKPGQCPNTVSIGNGNDNDDEGSKARSTKGVLHVALLGGPEVDASAVDLSSIRLAGAVPLTTRIGDRYGANCTSSPNCKFRGHDYSGDCTQTCHKRDGFADIQMTFSTADVVDGLGAVIEGELNQVELVAWDTAGIKLLGTDCLIVIVPGGDDDDDDGDGDGSPPAPNTASLGAAVPNPFNPVTRISYIVPNTGGYVQLSVYDVKGRLVSRPVNGVMNPGEHFVQFDASSLASGVYFYRLNIGKFSQTKKMVVLK